MEEAEVEVEEHAANRRMDIISILVAQQEGAACRPLPGRWTRSASRGEPLSTVVALAHELRPRSSTSPRHPPCPSPFCRHPARRSTGGCRRTAWESLHRLLTDLRSPILNPALNENNHWKLADEIE